MFDIGLFVNKEYSVHTHCSLLCLNDKYTFSFRVYARIEQPVNSAKENSQPGCFRSP